MRIEWSFDAAADVARLDRFLRAKSPTAAERATRTIKSAVNRLRDTPEIGRPRQAASLSYRELVVPFGKGGYLVLYRFDGRTVFIVAVRHMREASYRHIELE